MSEGHGDDAQRLHLACSRELGLEVIDGVWPEGTPRTLEEISDRFGISRTVAREASAQLEALGLVLARRRRGLVAQSPSAWNYLNPLLIEWRLHSSQREDQLRSLTQLRLVVEPEAADGAARNADIHTRARLLPLAAEMRRTGEAGALEEFLQHDIEFHRLILRSSGNELFAALSDLVATVLQGRTELGLMQAQPMPVALAGHEAVAEAIFRGQPEQARAAMQGILDEVRAAIAD
ncbi:FadR/GntR family transcriptional regulator [Salana multivorans]